MSWICVSICLFFLAEQTRAAGQVDSRAAPWAPQAFSICIKSFSPEQREGERQLLSLTYALRRAVHAKE